VVLSGAGTHNLEPASSSTDGQTETQPPIPGNGETKQPEPTPAPAQLPVPTTPSLTQKPTPMETQHVEQHEQKQNAQKYEPAGQHLSSKTLTGENTVTRMEGVEEEEHEKFHCRVPKEHLTTQELAFEFEKLVAQVDRIENQQQNVNSKIKSLTTNLIKNAYLIEDQNNQLAPRTFIVSGFNEFDTHNDPRIFENQCAQRDFAVAQLLRATGEILPQSCHTKNLLSTGTLTITNRNKQMEMSKMSVVVLDKPYQRNVLFKFLKDSNLEKGAREMIDPNFSVNNDPNQGPDPWKLGNCINQDANAGWLVCKREIALHNRLEGIPLKVFMEAYNKENGQWDLAPDWNGNSVVIKMAQRDQVSGYVAFFAYNKYDFTCTVYLSTELLNTDRHEANDVIVRFHKLMKQTLRGNKGKGKGKGKKGQGKHKNKSDDSDSESSTNSEDELNLVPVDDSQEMNMKGKGKSKGDNPNKIEDKRQLIFPFTFEFKMVDDKTDDPAEWQKTRPWKEVWNDTKHKLRTSAKRIKTEK